MSSREEHRRDFNEWLEQILADNQFLSPTYDKVLTHLESCTSASALLVERDALCDLLHHELVASDLPQALNRLSLSSTCEELSDEIVARYYLTDCNSEERASIDSGVEEEQLHQPQFLQQITIALTPINNDSGNISKGDSPTSELCLGELVPAPKFVTPRGHLPQPPMLKVGSLPTCIGPGYYPQLPGRNCVAAYRNKTPTHIVSKPIRVNRARGLSATYDNSDLQQFYVSPRSHSVSSTQIPMGFVQPTVCDLSVIMNMRASDRQRRSKHSMYTSGASPQDPSGQRFFAPIRSDSMQWAYDEVMSDSAPQNQRKIHRPIPEQPLVQSFLATLAQRPQLLTPKIDDANAKLEDDELLSFVGGIAAHQPLCDADDE